MHLRDVHLNHSMHKSIKVLVKKPSLSMRKTLEKECGYPLRPKGPLPPFFRFLKEVQPSVAMEHPNLKSPKIISIIGQMWRSLETAEKEKFIKEYTNELAKYSDEVKNYKQAIPDDGKRKMKEKQKHIKATRIKRLQGRNQR